MAAFESIFHTKLDYNPDNRQADAAVKHRKELGGTLFFDRMWDKSNLGKANKAYPPKSNGEFKDLWKRILDAPVSEEQKLGLQYYLIRDCRNGNLEKIFLQKTYLPEKYQILVTGLWEIDRGQFSRALEYLTDPTLIPSTFADEILAALLRHPRCDQSQAMAYYLTVQPPLQDRKTLDEYFDILTQIDVTGAYNFAHQHPEHERLFERLVSSIQSAEPGKERADAAVQFVGLPFTGEEIIWLDAIALDGSTKLPAMKDTLVMQQMATGQPLSNALQRYQGEKVDGVDWQDLQRITSG